MMMHLFIEVFIFYFLNEARVMAPSAVLISLCYRDINPHIPQYIVKAPWYFGSDGFV